ncbi:THAP domain-containing protein 11 [Centrocercus urophasianus]|uniref:THAP domain-containing protein 11 n=1 Tax=Centrocercus urophasianus TaxID=9002 RepID=UPI001C649907|nr:THAP domain-containing protein 11 [Centrocercus urophasianus]XP_042732861.1 THAP domain-containing protein 11 [Lagopus leucura]XP_048814259.1 THAP domain-containing protein 11 [Lagopus muta]XP_052542139.1 THAP domain-containing protein 11 [Tympanuchus pallidicinctus]
MPGFTCCVPGCYNNSHRDKALHFYTFPKDEELRRLWLKNVSRAGVSGCFSTFQPTTGHRVCSEHFQGGRKSYLVRVPTIFPLRGVNERKAARAARRPRPAAASAAAATVVVAPQGPGPAAEAPVGGAAEDVKPIDLTVQVELGAAAAGPGPCWLPVGQEGPVEGGPPDHSYSLSSGTTSEELLRKLNEQRDIIALLEVKMKEMKGSIRRLRLAEAQLREEIREKDRLLHAASVGARKRHGL